MFIVDAHLDLSYNVMRGRDVTKPAAEQPAVDGEIATVGLPDLRRGGVGLICATIFCPPRNYRNRGYTTADEARAIAMEQLTWYRKQVDDGRMNFVTSRAELPAETDSTSTAGPLRFILLMEGADAFRSPADVAEWFEHGLRIVGLAWRKNRMAGGTGHPGPLSDEGRGVVRALDRAGIIHDTSHLADEAFWELLDLASSPVIASHSNCRTIVPGDRQLSDEMIRAIVKRDGVVGVNFYDEFLLPPEQYKKRRCKMSDVIAHLKHMADVIGDGQHIALGTDMDGGVGRDDIPFELSTAADLPRVGDHLSAAGFGDEDVRGIMGGNWLRFFRGALPA
ncbi:MAG: rane dipeptidase [Phycisphaerales bacterium]|jgi:membrane dipeptidase|nr:rane dipeptidase [Phycisphaerales bacterium]